MADNNQTDSADNNSAAGRNGSNSNQNTDSSRTVDALKVMAQRLDTSDAAEDALKATAGAVMQHIGARSNNGEISAQYIAAALPIGLMYAMDNDIQGFEYAVPAVAPIMSLFANYAERKRVEDTRQPARFIREPLGEEGGTAIAKALGWDKDNQVNATEVNLNNGLAALTLAAPYLARLAKKK